MFAKMHLLSLGVWLCGSFGSLFAQETENDPRDFAALADPARLEQLVAECQRLGDEVRGEAFDTPTLSLASQAANECLIKAAVKEFSENLSSTGFDPATFERELREGAERQAGLISDLYCYDRYELNVCGTMGAAYFEGAKQEYVLEILSELWAVYSRFAP